MSSKSLLVVSMVAVVVLVAGIGLSGLLREPQGAPTTGTQVVFPGPENQGQPSSILPAEPKPGRQIYKVTTEGAGPQIIEAVIDGFDASAGQTQRMGVLVQFAEPVESVVVTLSGDQGSSDHVLQLAEGSKTDGRWEGSWTAAGTHKTVYQAAIRAAAFSTASQVTLAFK